MAFKLYQCGIVAVIGTNVKICWNIWVVNAVNQTDCQSDLSLLFFLICLRLYPSANLSFSRKWDYISTLCNVNYLLINTIYIGNRVGLLWANPREDCRACIPWYALLWKHHKVLCDHPRPRLASGKQVSTVKGVQGRKLNKAGKGRTGC